MACDGVWRRIDHLSLVAGISRVQRKQLDLWETRTVEALARFPLPIPQRPAHGSKESYVRVREQARIQVAVLISELFANGSAVFANRLS